MKTKKIKLPDGAIEFLTDTMKEKNISLNQAIIEWNKKQEIDKFLRVGSIVKIHTEKFNDFNGKKGFIGAILSPTGMGFDLEKSGKFSVYLLECEKHHIQRDCLGFQLESTGETISDEFLTEYLKHAPINTSMREELEQAMQKL